MYNIGYVNRSKEVTNKLPGAKRWAILDVLVGQKPGSQNPVDMRVQVHTISSLVPNPVQFEHEVDHKRHYPPC
jgi:hypothetical protein